MILISELFCNTATFICFALLQKFIVSKLSVSGERKEAEELDNRAKECEIKIDVDDIENTCCVEPSYALDSGCVEPVDILDVVYDEKKVFKTS